MSTKTTFKRIALVTVAALGFGVMSVAPSSAAANAKIQCEVADGLAASANTLGTTTTNGACSGVAGAFNYVTLKIAADADNVITSTTKITAASGVATVSADGLSAITVGAGNIQIATPVAGTITVSYWVRTAGVLAASAAETVTITVNAAAQSGVVSAAKSTSILVASDTASTAAIGGNTADATASVSAVYLATPRATIKVKILDALGVAANDSLTATIASATGAGSVASGVINNTAGALSGVTNTGLTSATSASADTGGLHNFYVYSNGIAGTAVITIKAGTTTVATESVTFVGAAASYSVAVGATTFTGSNYAVGANASALKVTAKDAASNTVVDGTVINAFDGTAATATVLATATTTSGVATFSLTGVAAGTSVITFGNGSTAAASTVTATKSIEVTKSTAKTVALSLDKDSYEPGEKMTLTITATDANGKGVADGTYTTLFSAALKSNFGLANSSDTTLAATNSIVTLGGKATVTLYAPAVSGKLTITGTQGAAVDAVAAGGTGADVVATATVANAALTAAQEATDAANEATDAGNNAKDAADQAIEAADAATIAAQDAAAAAELAGEVAVAAAEAAGAIAQDALDAANAATDAALSAAEAADAATAAATEAKESADAATAAVAALSAEVAKLMADLNLRITKLGNTLATILKKLTK